MKFSTQYYIYHIYILINRFDLLNMYDIKELEVFIISLYKLEKSDSKLKIQLLLFYQIELT